MTSHAVAALMARRSSLLVEIRRAEAVVTKLLADLEHLDGAVQLLGQPHKPPSRMSNYGAPVQITRTLLTILRKSGQPMTVQELTAALMRELGLAQADARRVRSMTTRVRAALGAQLRQEVLVREPGKAGRGPVWRVFND